jgi:hypothetical protein
MLTYRVEKELLLKPFEINEEIDETKSELYRKKGDAKFTETVKILENKIAYLEKEQENAISEVQESRNPIVAYPRKVVAALMKIVLFQDYDKDEYLNALRALGVIAV